MKIITFLSFWLFLTINLFSQEILPADNSKGRSADVFAGKVIVRIKPGYDIFSKDAILLKGKEYKVQYLLNPKYSFTYNNKLMNKIENRLQSTKIINAEEKLLRTFTINYNSEMEPEEYCRHLLLSNPAVEIAEPCYVPILMSYVPNDPLVSNQDEYLQLISAYEAWDIEKGNPDVIIGISDSGTNQQHEDIVDNLGINQGEIPLDGLDNDSNGYIDDYAGYNFSWQSTSQLPGDTYNNSETHGQQVTGIAAAKTDNGIGIAGIGFKSRVFPLKIIEGASLKYAYESIVYAAVRGLKVINCSWGVVKPYSDIDQSIINYALSKDVSIVAAAGNTSGKATKYDIFYPADYYGVLGVGEVNANDRLTSSSSIASGCRILAPGDNYMTTTNTGYFPCDGGTSFASPVVAGAVALARSRFPQLSGLQAIEFVRQAVDVHQNFSLNDRSLIPGRINLLKAVSVNPFSIPAILPEKYRYFDRNGEETDRFSFNDRVNIKIIAKNVLGSASNLDFKLSIAHDPANSVSLRDSTFHLDLVEAGQLIEISNFSLQVIQNYSGNVIMRVDIIGENGYKDFFKFNFVPAKGISTFSNEQIKFSMSDIGEFGYSTNSAVVSGSGFTYQNYGNQIYRNSSIMFSASPDKIIYNSSVNKIYGFGAAKGFVSPERNIGIYDDSKAGSNRLGIGITQKITFPAPNSKAVRFEFSIMNYSEFITDGALGIYIDWDVGADPAKNKTKLLPDAVPVKFKGAGASAQAVYFGNDYPYFGSAVYSAEQGAEAQAAGLDFNFTSDFNDSQRYSSLNSGTSIQSQLVSDMGTVTGIKFKGEWGPDQKRVCVICIGAGDDEYDLKESLKNCLLNVTDVDNQDESKDVDILIFPNPSNDAIYLRALNDIDEIRYSLTNILGNKVSDESSYSGLKSGEQIGMDISKLPSGVYLLNYIADGDRHVGKIYITR
ncbi:MAG: S8 family serine peptidase [Candidatus Kapabacteria bacterium]|nr:S8 family serine peptidase [Candidatus Kapabacteria bacterium]